MSLEELRIQLESQEAAKELESVGSETETTEEVKVEETEPKPEREFTALELEQMERGWDPYKEGGVSAEEFKRVGEIIEAKRKSDRAARSARDEIKELTGQVKQLIEHNKAMAVAAYEAKQRELSIKRMEAIREGDVDATMALEQEQANLREAQNAAVKAESSQQGGPAPGPDAQQFIAKYEDLLNGRNAEALAFQGVVQGVIADMQRNSPNATEKQVVDKIEETLAEALPHKFGKQPESKVAKVAVSSPGSSKGSSPSLSLEDKILFESIQAVDPSFTMKDFTNMYLKNKK